MIERHIREGTIVPVEVTCGLLEKAMIEHCNLLTSKNSSTKDNGDIPSEKKLRGKFLIDGFPRNEDNLQSWKRQLADRVEVAFVVFLDCSLVPTNVQFDHYLLKIIDYHACRSNQCLLPVYHHLLSRSPT